MKNIRKYGRKPFSVAVIHGGPGAPGEVAPVATALSNYCGTLEPLQTAGTIEGQVQELKNIFEEHGDLPITLIGFSWGAWLSIIFAARYPLFVNKLILVGSGPLEEKYAYKIMATRLSRLSEHERLKLYSLQESLNDINIKDKDRIFAQVGKILSKSDSLEQLISDSKYEEMEFQYEIYQSVWNEASKLRSSGELVNFVRKIKCPILAIHGDYDPHPFEGIEKPLAQINKDFRFILLTNCGHIPWNESNAKDKFYEILKNEL